MTQLHDDNKSTVFTLWKYLQRLKTNIELTAFWRTRYYGVEVMTRAPWFWRDPSKCSWEWLSKNRSPPINANPINIKISFKRFGCSLSRSCNKTCKTHSTWKWFLMFVIIRYNSSPRINQIFDITVWCCQD